MQNSAANTQDIRGELVASPAYASERRSREYFTAKLVEICKRLDVHARESRKGIKVLTLWAVGSWSRGAPACGDLDILISSKGCSDPNLTLRQDLATVIGRPRDVDIITGNPQENSSGVAFLDPVAIWSPGADWRAAIKSISSNPSATRMTRQWDALPFEYRDFAPYQKNDDLLKLLALQKSGVIQWSVHDIQQEDTRPFEDSETTSSMDAVMWVVGKWSTTRKKTFNAMVRHMRGARPVSLDGCAFGRSDCQEAILGGVRYRVRAPYIHCAALEDHFEHLELAMALPWSKTGRNLMWRIRRGPNHPQNLEFADTKAWVHWDISRQRPSFEEYSRIDGMWGTALGLSLFSSQQNADEALGRLIDDDLVEDGEVVSREIGGCELVEFAFSIDHVDIDDGVLHTALNPRAALISGLDTQTDAISVLRWLRNAAPAL